MPKPLPPTVWSFSVQYSKPPSPPTVWSFSVRYSKPLPLQCGHSAYDILSPSPLQCGRSAYDTLRRYQTIRGQRKGGGRWSNEEDRKLKNGVALYGPHSWIKGQWVWLDKELSNTIYRISLNRPRAVY